ncbi:glycoside hydrolase family 26 protein [Sphingobacterium siyangense]|uniref:Mannan endo-1,4-beta-mannosidase n=1 Tax=Sphingobacterium siyangense TaxID=459529 RepID=A0A562MG74_9SPHI|nr:glycosyl hydrolase [Sphingobacterium siyangense]TWI18872.1 mannan endo-1,4-beta-mannosidase [Sphingobacterium siyangense]
MMNTNVVFYLVLVAMLLNYSLSAQTNGPIDRMATSETVALYKYLKSVQSQGKVLLGQQDALCYGRHWKGEPDRSDIKEVTGSHPVLLGLDFQPLTHEDKAYRESETKRLVNVVKDMYRRGGIITFSWHMSNPVNGGSYEWKNNPQLAVSEILPGGRSNAAYQSYLRRIGAFLAQCKGSKGEAIPIIFRPFHELDGDWFWWGKGHATPAEFIHLWRYTVNYLRQDLGIHQLLFAFSPDCKFRDRTEYLAQFPGDDYVDILGMDNYWDFRPDGANDPAAAAFKMGIVSAIAQEKSKIAALTETGLELITDPNWFTQILQPILAKWPLAYCMLWRNADDIPTHYYVPTKDHPAAADFKKFCQSANIILLNNNKLIYNAAAK